MLTFQYFHFHPHVLRPARIENRLKPALKRCTFVSSWATGALSDTGSSGK
jgi:hypothetical protein